MNLAKLAYSFVAVVSTALCAKQNWATDAPAALLHGLIATLFLWFSVREERNEA